MVNLQHLFYNPNLSPRTNNFIWWTWECILHHFYFIVLWFQRQFSDKWNYGDSMLWRLNMEKECDFFKMLFGGDSKFCAEGTITVFAGLWFRTDKPVESQLSWIGRIITNYQQTEATAHLMIFFSGLAIILLLSGETQDRFGASVPITLRWIFFGSILFEVVTMCVPYSVLFTWVLFPFMNDNGVATPLASTLRDMAPGDPFLAGFQLGAALITMAWVSHVVLLLDGIAMFKAWNFANNGKQKMLINVLFWGSASAVLVHFLMDFFSPSGRGFHADQESMSTRFLDRLHGMIGTDHTPMRELVNASTTCLQYP